MKNTKNIIIIALLLVIVTMAVGYSAFASQLTLNGTAEIVGVWDVKIVNIETKEMSEGCEDGEPQYTNTSATFDAKLAKPGDFIIYEVTIKNAGTLDAKLDHVLFQSDEENGSPKILYTTTELDNFLEAGEQTSFTVTVKYDETTNELPSVKTKTITGIIEYVQN